MSVVFIILFLIQAANGYNNILVAESKRLQVAPCVCSIIKKYFSESNQITFVDINSQEDLLRALEGNVNVTFISRTPHVRLSKYNHIYLIHARGINDFAENFHHLTKEKDWNPRSKFLIIVNDIVGDLRAIFDELLKYHATNALVVEGRESMNMYTYEPFENFGCGKRYDDIVYFGKCLQPNVGNLFPDKTKTGLRNCTFNVESAHWPPFATDPNRVIVRGVEQAVLKFLAESEHFNINYTYVDNAEIFSLVQSDMTAIGPLQKLQDNEVDMNIGGMLLVASRTEAFDYIWSHMMTDEIIVLVQKSRELAAWKYIYIEFPASVWALLIIAFLVYSVLMIFVFKVKDRGSFTIKMFDTLLSHGIQAKFPTNVLLRLVLLHWIWFAYLIGLHYQTSLTSLTTHPLHVYQISDTEDLRTYKIKSCVSQVMHSVLSAEQLTFEEYENNSYTRGCTKYLESISTVSETDEAFTVSFSASYLFYKNEFCDVAGCKLYTFKQPLNMVLHSMYLYKGFPMLDELHLRTLRFRENGMVEKCLDVIYTSRELNNKVHMESFKSLFVIPWYIVIFGTGSAFFAFVIELIKGRFMKHGQSSGRCYTTENRLF